MSGRNRRPWSWGGAVAMVVALAVGGGFLFAMIGVTVQHETVSTQGAALLNTLGGGLIAVLSLWIGGQVESAKRDEREATMTTTTPEPTPDEPRDPATDPDRDLGKTPQDPDATQPQSDVPDQR